MMAVTSLINAQGKIEFKKPILKLKAVEEGLVVNMEFEATNIGDAPVRFLNYEVECHCTVATLPTEPVAPGATVKLPVTFDTKGKIGWQYRTVIYTTDSAQGQETVEFRIKVKN